jgi:hypothetical protein
MTLRSDFGPVFQRIRGVLPKLEFGFLHDEARRYLAKQWSGDRLKGAAKLKALPDAE